MQKLMAIFAHPDDEGAMGGTLAHYANSGTEVMLVCTTRGEVGEISEPSLATKETLGIVRQRELEAAAAALGIQHLRFLDYRDSGMVGTPENEDPRAQVNANPIEIRAKIVSLIREFKPDVVVTFEPFGWYGHPDHIATGRWATEAFPMAGDATVHPELGAPWQPKRLYHSVIPFSRFGGMMQEAIELGYMDPPKEGEGLQIPEEERKRAEEAVTHVIPISAQFERQEKSRACHKTQFGPDSMFSKIPRELWQKHSGNEHFIQVSPEPPAGLTDSPLNNLFA